MTKILLSLTITIIWIQSQYKIEANPKYYPFIEF